MTWLIDERALLDLHEDVLNGRMDGTRTTVTINLETQSYIHANGIQNREISER